MRLETARTAAVLAVFVACAYVLRGVMAVRPLFISGASRVPLVLALLGIVGGLETFGILGLFVGPTLVAIAVAVWRQLARSRS